jgi:sterol 24-C-methyltransferase
MEPAVAGLRISVLPPTDLNSPASRSRPQWALASGEEKIAMKMTAFEKLFVNRPGHTHSVAAHALELLHRIDLKRGWRYLDVGCGVGAAAREVAAAGGLCVTAVDLDPAQIEAANRDAAGPNLQYRVMDATKLEFDDAEFEVVASSMATHHIPNWEQAFKEMARVLCPGGYLVYSDFVFPSWLARIAQRFLWFAGMPSRRALGQLASATGLVPLYEAHRSGKTDLIWQKQPC